MWTAARWVRIGAAALVFASGCASDDDDDDPGVFDSCEVNGKTGLCEPFTDPSACIDSKTVCHCLVVMDQPAEYKSVDCDAFCQEQGHSFGLCVDGPAGPSCGCS